MLLSSSPFESMRKIGQNYLVPFLFTLLYALLPTSNSGIDGYAYASSVKWFHDIFWPHHLMYCPVGVSVNSFLNLFGFYPDVLSMMKVVNSVSAGFCLLVLHSCMKALEIYKSNYFVIFCGSCFGFMRFATENETYILPLFCSLTGTLLFILYGKTQKLVRLLFAGICFAIGVLFHQIHGFWYAAFGLILLFNSSSQKLKKGAIFIVPGALLITITYLTIYVSLIKNQLIGEKEFVEFIFRDVYSGQVNTQIGLNNIIMTPISFIRSFIQVHGYMKPLIEDYKILLLIPLGLIIIALVSIKSILKNGYRREPKMTIISNALLTAFIFQLSFAFYSVGNAEFMVMLPMIAALYLVTKFAIPVKPVLHLAFILLIYNMIFGLAPAHFLDLDGSKPLYSIIQKYPNSEWLLREPQKLENMFEFNFGPNSKKQQIMLRNIPDREEAKNLIYTDFLDMKETLNRGNLLNKVKREVKFVAYHQEAIDSFGFFGGKRVIYKLSLKE